MNKKFLQDTLQCIAKVVTCFSISLSLQHLGWMEKCKFGAKWIMWSNPCSVGQSQQNLSTGTQRMDKWLKYSERGSLPQPANVLFVIQRNSHLGQHLKHSSYWSRDMRTGDKRRTSWSRTAIMTNYNIWPLILGPWQESSNQLGILEILRIENQTEEPIRAPRLSIGGLTEFPSLAQPSSLFTSCTAKITGQGRTTFSSSHAASHKPREDEKKTCLYRYVGAQEVVAATDSVAL